jgi:CRISPR/Cas system-associated exonuclease Cas4 (RecB family)
VANHSQLVGGSNVDRLLNCNGSYQLINALPPQPDSTSTFAEEGTFGHEVMDISARLRMKDNKTNMRDAATGLLGTHVYDREVTQKHLDELIYPAIEQLQNLERTYGGGFKVVAVEAKVRFPGVPAFGTADLILRSDSHIILADYKFGVGVVTAVYADEHGERMNPQLMFYLAAAQNSLPRLFTNKRKLAVAIIQPRAEVPLTYAEVQPEEVTWFVQDVERAVDAALSRDPPLVRGDHCKWCPAKTICPKWVGPIKALALIGKTPEQRTEMVSKEVTPFAEYLARTKQLTDDLAVFAKEIDAQLKAYLEDGGTVPGYVLQPKKKQRQWAADEKSIAYWMENNGFTDEEMWQVKLQTFAVADKAAKRLGVKIPEDFRVTPPTDETVVVRAEEATLPPVERPLAIEQFAASAAKLSRKG